MDMEFEESNDSRVKQPSDDSKTEFLIEEFKNLDIREIKPVKEKVAQTLRLESHHVKVKDHIRRNQKVKIHCK
jgi:hypothetical protein